MNSLWLLRILAVAGLAISILLFVQKLTGDTIAGCGGESGCATVLISQWSQFFYIPVSALAALMYVGVFGATWKPSRPLFIFLAICFTGAALWFFGILLFELKAFCPWCTGAHVIGLTTAAVLFISARKLDPEKGNIHLGVVAGLLAVIILPLGQIIGPVPQTHLEVEEDIEVVEDKNVAVHARGAGRVVPVFDDKKFYNTTTLPHLGPADAPHVIVKYFDYSCSSCLTMHKDLEMVAEKHPGKFCMIMLPVPLSRECNEHFPKPYTNHKSSCELARLCLAAWRVKPEVFPEVHEVLFTRPIMEPEMAEIAVGQIVGEEALAKALEDPWIEEIIEADKRDFQQFIEETLKMPKLLVGNKRMLHGLPQSAEVLLRSLEQEFKLPQSQ